MRRIHYEEITVKPESLPPERPYDRPSDTAVDLSATGAQTQPFSTCCSRHRGRCGRELGRGGYRVLAAAYQLRRGQGESESGGLARCALGPDAAPVSLNQPLADVQAQARSALLLCQTRPVEASEDLRQLLGGNARPLYMRGLLAISAVQLLPGLQTASRCGHF